MFVWMINDAWFWEGKKKKMVKWGSHVCCESKIVERIIISISGVLVNTLLMKMLFIYLFIYLFWVFMYVDNFDINGGLIRESDLVWFIDVL